MADYQYEDFDTYGYIEPVGFTSLYQECGVKYEEKEVIEPELTEVDSFISEKYPNQNILSIPEDKCLRR